MRRLHSLVRFLFPSLTLAACAAPPTAEEVARATSAETTRPACEALEARPGAPRAFFAPFEPLEDEAACVLDTATREVLVAHYNIRSARMIGKLVELRRRGVDVRVAVDEANAAQPYNTGDDALEAAGIRVVRTKPGDKAIMHLKVAVVDGAVALSGSFNWNDTAAHANDENMVVFREPHVVARYADHVRAMLGEVPRVAPGSERPSFDPSARVRVHFAPDERLDAVLRREIDAARERIDVAMFTFTMSNVADALRRAQARGVAVRVVTERKQEELSDVDDSLAAAGIRVVRAANRIGAYSAMHHKYAVIDGRRVLTGAANWTFSGTRRNDEDLVVLDDAALARRYAQSFADLVRVYTGADPSEGDLELARGEAPIFFHAVHGGTSYGDRVLVVGSLPALGEWDPSRGVPLETTSESFPSWTARARVPSGADVAYKLVTVRSSGEVVWEAGADRTLKAPATGRATVVSGAFGDTTASWTPDRGS